MSDQANLSLRISAEDQATPELAGIGAMVEHLTNSVASINEEAGGVGGGFTNLTSSIHEAGNEAEHSEGMFSGLTEGLGELKSMALGMVAGGLMMNLLGGVSGFFEGAKDKVAELGDATFKLMSVTGQSAESTSELLSVFEKFGIGTKEASTSLGLFEKGLNGVDIALEDGGKLPKGFTQALTELGLSAKDQAGNIKPMTEMLNEVADSFAKMPDGAEKTAIAMSLFGRAGKDMIPVLDQGREGLADLMAEAGKLGLSLSGENVAQIRQYSLAQNQMSEAVGGLQLQLGLALLPALLSVTEAVAGAATAFNQSIRPAIASVLGPIGDFTSAVSNDTTAMSILIGVVTPFAALWAAQTAAMAAMTLATTAQSVATGVLTGAQGLLNLALDANPIGLVIAGLAGLVAALDYAYHHSETFRNAVDALFSFLKGQLDNLILIGNTIADIFNKALGVINTVITAAGDNPLAHLATPSINPAYAGGGLPGGGTMGGQSIVINHSLTINGQADAQTVRTASMTGVLGALQATGVR